MTHKFRIESKRDSLAWLAILAAAAFAISMLTTGCSSTAARNVRHDWAVEKRTDALELAKTHRTKDRAVADDQLAREIAAKDAALLDQNARAGDDVDRVAQNYIDYFHGLDTLRAKYVDDYAAAEELYDQGAENAEAPTAVSEMADKELTVAKAAAISTLNAAKDAAVKLYAKYQETHPIPKPSDSADPSPTPAAPDPVAAAAQSLNRHK